MISVTTSEVLIIIGLILDILAIYFLSLATILERNPFKTLYRLWNLSDEEIMEEHDGLIVAAESGFKPLKPTADVIDVKQRAKNSSIGTILLISGFVLQIIGTLI